MQVLRQTCVICGEEMRLPGLLAADLGLVCGSAHCRVLVARRPGMNEQAFRQLIAIRRRQGRLQRELEMKYALRLAAKKAAEARENEVLWDSVDPGSSGGQQARHLRVVVPSGPRRLSPLPQRRRNLHRDHLNRIIAGAAPRVAAFAAQPARPAPGNAGEPATGALCGLCKGGCCTRGDYKAYLTEATVLRFMSQHRELRPRDVLAAYLDRLASRTETDSCVHHGARGCTLPREMRSDICNDFYCESIAAWRAQRATRTPGQGTLVIVRRQDTWSRNLPDAASDVIGVHFLGESGEPEPPLNGVTGLSYPRRGKDDSNNPA